MFLNRRRLAVGPPWMKPVVRMLTTLFPPRPPLTMSLGLNVQEISVKGKPTRK